ncbi:MAG TPA: o-succinylbenzoate synthase [Terriglobia bacterium]|nr:o-succinylbenzoate synthase [Terriglobia bacterium]
MSISSSREHRVFIKQIEMRELRMRLLHPFETSFGSTQDRHIILIKVSDGTRAGWAGWGEVTAAEGPFYSYETWETAWHVLRDFVIPRVVGKELAAAADFGSLVQGIRGHNMAKAGVETALWDLEAKTRNVPLWKMLGGTRQRIDCGVSIGIQPSVAKLLEKIDTELKAGYRRIKIKIKPGWDVDVIRDVRSAFPDIRLMGDANSAYTLADVDVFKRMDRYNVMMFEQPLHHEDMIDHAELQKQIQTPICLDESIHSAEDARKAIKIGACRIINIKLGRVGGHKEARAVHNVCRDHGIPVWCGGMLESGIGRAHNVALSSLENFSLPGDVSASKRYWSEDIIDPPVEVSADGQIEQSDRPGIGYKIKEDLIESLTVRSQVFTA